MYPIRSWCSTTARKLLRERRKKSRTIPKLSKPILATRKWRSASWKVPHDDVRSARHRIRLWRSANPVGGFCPTASRSIDVLSWRERQRQNDVIAGHHWLSANLERGRSVRRTQK